MSSQQDQPYRAGQPYVREYDTTSRPFALPGPDQPPATREEPSASRASSPTRTRTWRKLLAVAVSIVLLAGLGVSTAFSSQPKRVLVVDSFERPAAVTWGRPEIGSPWMYPSGRAGTAIAGGRGVMSLVKRGPMRQAWLDTTVRDVSVQFDFSLDQMTGGSGVQVMALLRQSKAGVYQARVGIGRKGRVMLSVVKVSRDGTKRRLGKPVAIPGSRYRNGHSLTVRAQAIKAAPTQIRMMVWPTGRAPRQGLADRAQRQQGRSRRGRAHRHPCPAHPQGDPAQRHGPLRRRARQSRTRGPACGQRAHRHDREQADHQPRHDQAQDPGADDGRGHRLERSGPLEAR